LELLRPALTLAMQGPFVRCLVVGFDRHADEHTGQEREHVRLHEADDDLEQVDAERQPDRRIPTSTLSSRKMIATMARIAM